MRERTNDGKERATAWELVWAGALFVLHPVCMVCLFAPEGVRATALAFSPPDKTVEALLLRVRGFVVNLMPGKTGARPDQGEQDQGSAEALCGAAQARGRAGVRAEGKGQAPGLESGVVGTAGAPNLGLACQGVSCGSRICLLRGVVAPNFPDYAAPNSSRLCRAQLSRLC